MITTRARFVMEGGTRWDMVNQEEEVEWDTGSLDDDDESEKGGGGWAQAQG